MSRDPDDVVRGFDYTIEAGSSRKPNKETKIAQLTELGQYALPVFQQFAAQGQVEPFNAYMAEVCQAQGIDPRPFQVQPPQSTGPSPEEQQMQAEMQMKVQELQLQITELQAKLALQQQAQEQELRHAEAMHQLELDQKRQELTLKKQESQARVQATKKSAAKRQPAGA